VRRQGQLALDDERSDEDDARAAVGRETAREVDRVPGLLDLQQRHDDVPVRDRARPARQPSGAAPQRDAIGQPPPHRSSG
jgi:hypothetical protein